MQSLTVLRTFAPILFFSGLMDSPTGSSALANDSIKPANEAGMSLVDHMDQSGLVRLIDIAATYWTRSWASLADVTNVIGQAVEEAAYDFEGFAGLDAPTELNCIDDFWTHLHDKTQIFTVGQEEMTYMERQKRLLEVSKFRIEAQKSLSCLLGKGIEEDEAIGSLLDAVANQAGLLLER